MPSKEKSTGIIWAVSISILSLLVSALILAINYSDYLEDRRLILKADFVENSGIWSIKVYPITNSHFLLGEAFFPESILNETVKIDSEGAFRWMGSIQAQCKNIIEEKIKPRKGYVQISTLLIPIVIKSLYASHGKTYSDISLYYLSVLFTRGEEEHDVKITFNGLIFDKHLPINKLNSSIYKNLNEIWNTKEGIIIPYREPSIFPWK